MELKLHRGSNLKLKLCGVDRTENGKISSGDWRNPFVAPGCVKLFLVLSGPRNRSPFHANCLNSEEKQVIKVSVLFIASDSNFSEGVITLLH